MSAVAEFKRGESADLVRKALTESSAPLTATEIITLTGVDRQNVMTLLRTWAAKHAVTRIGSQGRSRHPGYKYKIGPKKLRTMRYDLTPEQKAEIQRERSRIKRIKRAAAAGKSQQSGVSDLPHFGHKNGKEARTTRVINQSRFAKASSRKASLSTPKSSATQAHETIAAFLKRGGKIEKLPGLKKSEAVAPRRPVVQFRGVQAI